VSQHSALPPRPDLDQLRRQAKDLLSAAKSGQSAAVTLIAAVGTVTTLAAAQLAIARGYGFPSWNALKLEVERRTVLDDGDLSRLSDLLAKRPELATMERDHWLDHPLGAAPLSYVAMQRYDTRGNVWRRVPGTGALARALLAAGAPVDGRPGDSETPLMTAASYGDADVAEVLIEAGADLDATASADAGGVPGGSALLHAAVFGNTDVVDVLVVAGATVRSIEEAAAAGDISGWLTPQTPPDAKLRALVMAADHERLEVIDQLIAAGTPVDGVDPVFGRHPLRTAAAGGRPSSVARLLAHGADPNLEDAEGRTPLDLCREARRQFDDRTQHDRVEAILTAVTT
jgi:uncharacterized protein